MATILKCNVSQGQFSNELAVSGRQFDGQEFSLLVAASDVEAQLPADGSTGEGWMRVQLLSKKGDLCLVKLPRPTFENGQIVTVRVSEIRG